MIFNASSASQTQDHVHVAQKQTRTHSQIFTHSNNDRTAGGIPTWRTAQTQLETIASGFVGVQNSNSTNNALSYRGNNNAQSSDIYTFGDLVDIVNPLHHIPLVNYAYREITGDTIRPSGNVIGGAVFGGAVGAASGLVNVIVAEETGKDITENAVSVLRDGESVVWRQKSPQVDKANAETIKTWNNPQDLPASLLAFTEQPLPRKAEVKSPLQPRYNA